MTTLSPAQIAGYAKVAGFTGAQVPIMTAIALAESGGQTEVTHVNSNGSVDRGVWQINDPANADILRIGDWRNPADNARMAKAIYDRQGYKAWSVFNSGRYASKLGLATQGAGNPVTLPTVNIPNPVDGLSLLTNPHTYFRVAMFFAGTTLLGMGLVMMGWGAAPDSVKKLAVVAAKAKVKG